MLGFNHILLNVKDEQFNIGAYREGGEEALSSHECNTVGCFIGHCTVLDKKENLEILYGSNVINFGDWASKFFDISYSEIAFLFGGPYTLYQHSGRIQKTEALLRVKYFIENEKIHPDWIRFRYKLRMSYTELTPYTIIDILSKEEYEFVKKVSQRCGCKMNTEDCYQYSETSTGSHIALWETPEKLGVIEAVGSYKWVITDRVKFSLT